MAILKKIVIDEISAVFRPAQKHAKVLIMKSANSTPETGDDAIDMIRKMQSNGDFDGFEKSDYMALLDGLAEEIRLDGESIQKAFTRGLETPAGVELFKLMKAAGGSEVKAPNDAVQDDTPKYDGPADAELNRLARERQKVTGRSFAQSFSDILDMPGNRKLTIQAAAERDLKMVRSLTMQEAVALEPAKPFPDYGSPGQKQPAATGRTTGSVVSGQRSQWERNY
ncbi:MAG: hypothetical protein ABSD11_13160 [Methylocella sp.]|jgi:hypothetical protein